MIEIGIVGGTATAWSCGSWPSTRGWRRLITRTEAGVRVGESPSLRGSKLEPASAIRRQHRNAATGSLRPPWRGDGPGPGTVGAGVKIIDLAADFAPGPGRFERGMMPHARPDLLESVRVA